MTQLGGNGIAVPTDHLVPDHVQQLSERLQTEFGKIDILVNDIWGAELLKGGPPEWNTPVWELDLAKGLPTTDATRNQHFAGIFAPDDLLKAIELVTH